MSFVNPLWLRFILLTSNENSPALSTKIILLSIRKASTLITATSCQNVTISLLIISGVTPEKCSQYEIWMKIRFYRNLLVNSRIVKCFFVKIAGEGKMGGLYDFGFSLFLFQ
jgi:hypothetical protein